MAELPSSVGRMAAAVALAVLLVAATALVFGVSVGNPSPDPDTLRTQVAEKNRSIDRYEATVNLTVDRPNGSHSLAYRIAVDRPNRVNLTVLEPENESGDVLLRNDSGAYSYDAQEGRFVRVEAGEPGTDLLTTLVQMVTNDSSYQGRDRLEGDSGVVLRYSAGESGVTLRIGGSAPAQRFVSEGSVRTVNRSVWIDPELELPVRVRQRVTSGNRTLTMDVRLTDVRLNPSFSEDRFRFDPPPGTEVLDRRNQTETYQSRRALVANASMSVPDPDLPEGYSFLQGVTARIEGNRTIAMTYRSNATSLIVAKHRPQQPINDNGTRVRVGDAEGRYSTAATSAMVAWQCDGATYHVTGTVSRKTLLSVARSIGCE